MALKSVPAKAVLAEEDKIVAFDHSTLHRLWEIQSICRVLVEATDEASGCSISNEQAHYALRGMERLLDSAIRRNGENSALGYDPD